MRKVYPEVKAAKKCWGCFEKDARPGKTQCAECAQKKIRQTKMAYRLGRRPGFCYRHKNNPVVEGKGHCAKCAVDLKRNYEKRKHVLAQRGKLRRMALRKEVMAAYGNRCACCGLEDWRFLSIDHIFNDGASHRAELKVTSHSMYVWLKRNGFPKDRYQALCYNCNFAKGYNQGICFHEEDGLNLDAWIESALTDSR